MEQRQKGKIDFVTNSSSGCFLLAEGYDEEKFRGHIRKKVKEFEEKEEATEMFCCYRTEEEPNYYREAYPSNEPMYCYDLEMILPRYSKAYRFEDERRTKYEGYAQNLLNSIFGTSENLKKKYMKRMGRYVILTDPNCFVSDYNEAVVKLQKWCRKNHITYRAIGAPDPRVYALEELYQCELKFLGKAEKTYAAWSQLRDYAENAVVANTDIKIDKGYCSCWYDSDDERYSWHVGLNNVGHIGNYRLAIKTEFDAMENIFKMPEKLPGVYASLYLTMEADNFSNPWAKADMTYPLKADQIPDSAGKVLKAQICRYIDEFDRNNRCYMFFGEKSWGHNFFRRIKQDFDAYQDINIVIQDGKVHTGYSRELPEEAVKKHRETVEMIEQIYEKLKDARSFSATS